MKTYHHFLMATVAGCGMAGAEIIASYDAGVTASASETGAADPTGQDWTVNGTGANNFAAAYDSGNGGWRTVDGTVTRPAYFSSANTGVDAVKLANAETVTMTWTLAMDKDAIGGDGSTVGDYYLAPNNGRQNNIRVVIDVDDVFSFLVTHTVDENNQLVLDYNNGTATLETGVDISTFPGFITGTLFYDTVSGQVTLSYDAGGGNTGEVTGLAPGADPDRVLIGFGAEVTAGQGSAVWNAFSIEIPDVDPGGGLTWTGASDGNWDLETTANWKTSDGTPVTFANLDEVSFDDTATTGAISVVGTVSPGVMSFNNSTLDYTLMSDGLGGIATLTKEGTGNLTLTGNSDYLGGTDLLAGTITAGDGATAGEIGQGPVTVAAGTTLTFNRTDLLDYKATPKMRNVSGEGDIVLDGGVVLSNYTGGGLGFNEGGSWAGFSGALKVLNDSEFQTIRNGATAMGTGTVVLGDESSSGNLAQFEGNWTWMNDINVIGASNHIYNRSAGSDRSLKLQGAISGTGHLIFDDSASSMNNLARGFVITNEVSVDGGIAITFGTPVRVGGVPGEVDVSGAGLDADVFGSLGTTAVANDGYLTFTRTDSHVVNAPISGEGEVVVGIVSSAGHGDTSTQVVEFGVTQPYTGFTTVASGRFHVAAGVSLATELVDVLAEGVLSGDGSLPGDVVVSGAVAPGGSVGQLTVAGDTDLMFNGGYQWEVSNWTGGVAGTDFDQLASDGINVLSDEVEPFVITILPDALTGFDNAERTFPIAVAATSLTGFDATAFLVDDSVFEAETGVAGTWTVQQNGSAIELLYAPGEETDYEGWATLNGLDPLTDGAPGADPDGDGVDNGTEYAFGLDPNNASSSRAMAGTIDATAGTFSYQRRDPLLTELTYRVETSDDLQTWTTDAGATELVTGPVASVETVEVTLTATPGANGKLFARIVAE